MSSPGEVLSGARLARGLSLEEAAGATRIRPAHLAALERWEVEALPAPVYVRGYLRTYAAFLGADPSSLLTAYAAEAQSEPQTPSIRPVAPPQVVRGPVFSGPLLGGSGLLLLVAAFALYSVHQLQAANVYDVEVPVPTVSPVFVSPPPLPSPSPAAPVARTLRVTLLTTDLVWLDVTVDGKRQAATYPAGTTLVFVGQRVKVSSGKGAATIVSLDGRDLGALGPGVATREFTAQT